MSKSPEYLVRKHGVIYLTDLLIDYDLKRVDYITAFISTINWTQIEGRLR